MNFIISFWMGNVLFLYCVPTEEQKQYCRNFDQKKSKKQSNMVDAQKLVSYLSTHKLSTIEKIELFLKIIDAYFRKSLNLLNPDLISITNDAKASIIIDNEIEKQQENISHALAAILCLILTTGLSSQTSTQDITSIKEKLPDSLIKSINFLLQLKDKDYPKKFAELHALFETFKRSTESYVTNVNEKFFQIEEAQKCSKSTLSLLKFLEKSGKSDDELLDARARCSKEIETYENSPNSLQGSIDYDQDIINDLTDRLDTQNREFREYEENGRGDDRDETEEKIEDTEKLISEMNESIQRLEATKNVLERKPNLLKEIQPAITLEVNKARGCIGELVGKYMFGGEEQQTISIGEEGSQFILNNLSEKMRKILISDKKLAEKQQNLKAINIKRRFDLLITVNDHKIAKEIKTGPFGDAHTKKELLKDILLLAKGEIHELVWIFFCLSDLDAEYIKETFRKMEEFISNVFKNEKKVMTDFIGTRTFSPIFKIIFHESPIILQKINPPKQNDPLDFVMGNIKEKNLLKNTIQ